MEINNKTWPRKKVFDFFSKSAWPFYSVTTPVEVEKVLNFSKQNGLSFYLTLVWACTKAMASVEEFRLRLEKRKVVDVGRLDPSFTVLEKGSDQFKIIFLPWEDDVREFCRKAKEAAANQPYFIAPGKEPNNLIYFSCLPWFDFTCLTNEHGTGKNDVVPRVGWGKIFYQDEKPFVHVSIEVNHRLIDGIHIARFLEALNKEAELLQ